MRTTCIKFLATGLVIAVSMAFGGRAQAETVSYTVGGWGPVQFPADTTPPGDAQWGVDGYPGDTVELAEYTGSLDLIPGTYTRKINTLLWTIDYTYGGTGENDWSNPTFQFNVLRNITIDGSTVGALSQNGLLVTTWENDFLSLDDGSTVSFIVNGYQIDVTPLGLAEVGGSNFSGGNPWVQPSRDVMARFDITALPVPTPSSLIAIIGMAIVGGVAAHRRRKRS